jgi:hypothetical protein
MREFVKSKKSHPLQWVVEPLEEEPSFIAKPMFGCVGCYLFGRLVLVLADRGEPWSGLLLPTEKNHHAALRRDHPALITHPVLKKWLYLRESHEDFEAQAQRLVRAILADDLRIGVEPKRTKA